MKKRFVLFMATLICLSVVVLGYAEGSGEMEPDAYDFNPDNYPNRHWIFMEDEEIASYEEIGWQRYVGVLWYDAEQEEADFREEVAISSIQELYNQGYTFHIIYHWVCPGEKLGKHQEQSVYAGRWILSPKQAIDFHQTYVVPDLTLAGREEVNYHSLWYYNNQECEEPDASVKEKERQNYRFVRQEYNHYDMGYGSNLYLRTGGYVEYTYDEACQLESVDGEMPFCR